MSGPDCHAFFRHDTAHAGARTRTCAHAGVAVCRMYVK